MSQRHPSTCTQTPTIYTRTANSAAIGSASTTATRPAGGAHISPLHGQQHCPRKLNRSSRDFRLPVEKEAGGGGLDDRRYPYNLDGCSRRTTQLRAAGRMGAAPGYRCRHGELSCDAARRLVGVRARKGRLLPSQRKYACPSLLLPYPGHNVFCTDVCGREAGRLRLKVKLMYLNDSSRVKMRVPDSQTAGPRQVPGPDVSPVPLAGP